MASNEVNVENGNASGSEVICTNTNVALNPVVLLVGVEHIDGRPVESEILMEATVKDLCTHTNPSHIPHAVEILSPHELCLTYEQGITLGHVASELMAVESWMGLPILITVLIIK